MRESIWGYAVITLGIMAVGIIWFFANVTRTDQHNYNLLKETVESAMFDSLDLAEYRKDGSIAIDEEKFVENFIRRFAENADLSNSYRIEIYDISTKPPKVSLRVSSVNSTTTSGELVTFDVVNNIDAILETEYPGLTYISNPGFKVSDITNKKPLLYGHKIVVPRKIGNNCYELNRVDNINSYVDDDDRRKACENINNWYETDYSCKDSGKSITGKNIVENARLKGNPVEQKRTESTIIYNLNWEVDVGENTCDPEFIKDGMCSQAYFKYDIVLKRVSCK